MKTTMMLFGFMLLLFSLIAGAIPAVPHQFQGSVALNGNPAPDGLLLVAMIDGHNVSAASTKNGKYGVSPDIFYVQDPDANREGKIIEFFISGTKVLESVFSNGAVTTLDFSVSGDFCGDGFCTGSESESSCPADCRPSPGIGPGSSGGGSGGGSNNAATTSIIENASPPGSAESHAECVPDWTCSDWGDCANGFQKRVCVDTNKCENETGKPALEGECALPAAPILLEGSNEAKSSSGLESVTGAITGASATSWMLLAILVAIITAAFLFIRWKFL